MFIVYPHNYCLSRDNETILNVIIYNIIKKRPIYYISDALKIRPDMVAEPGFF